MVIQSVNEDPTRPTKRENSRADEVKDTPATGLGLASDLDMVRMIDSERIRKCPLTGANVLNKADIRGQTLPNLKAKRTRKQGAPCPPP